MGGRVAVGNTRSPAGRPATPAPRSRSSGRGQSGWSSAIGSEPTPTCRARPRCLNYDRIRIRMSRALSWTTARPRRSTSARVLEASGLTFPGTWPVPSRFRTAAPAASSTACAGMSRLPRALQATGEPGSPANRLLASTISELAACGTAAAGTCSRVIARPGIGGRESIVLPILVPCSAPVAGRMETACWSWNRTAQPGIGEAEPPAIQCRALVWARAAGRTEPATPFWRWIAGRATGASLFPATRTRVPGAESIAEAL